MSCSGCKYLKESNKNVGAVSGCCYYCSKVNRYVNGANDNCDKFEVAYGRNTYTCNKIYEDGRDYYNNSTPIAFYLFIYFVYFNYFSNYS